MDVPGMSEQSQNQGIEQLECTSCGNSILPESSLSENSGMTRREFIKKMALGAGALFLSQIACGNKKGGLWPETLLAEEEQTKTFVLPEGIYPQFFSKGDNEIATGARITDTETSFVFSIGSESYAANITKDEGFVRKHSTDDNVSDRDPLADLYYYGGRGESNESDPKNSYVFPYVSLKSVSYDGELSCRLGRLPYGYSHNTDGKDAYISNYVPLPKGMYAFMPVVVNDYPMKTFKDKDFLQILTRHGESPTHNSNVGYVSLAMFRVGSENIDFANDSMGATGLRFYFVGIVDNGADAPQKILLSKEGSFSRNFGDIYRLRS